MQGISQIHLWQLSQLLCKQLHMSNDNFSQSNFIGFVPLSPFFIHFNAYDLILNEK